jgi:hypothetical protein
MGLSGGGILLLLALLKALFGRQFSWWKVTFFLSSFLLVLLVDCYMVHCSSFASLVSFWVSSSLLPFPFHGYATNRGGVLVCT